MGDFHNAARPAVTLRASKQRPRLNDYAAFLLLYGPPSLDDKFFGAAKIVFEIHLSK